MNIESIDAFKCLYVIDYIFQSRSNTIIQHACLVCKLLLQVRVEKINRDLHQPSRIRYVSRSFSFRCLVSLAYGKGLISAVTLSVVVPQAIGSFLHNINASLYDFLLDQDDLEALRIFGKYCHFLPQPLPYFSPKTHSLVFFRSLIVYLGPPS